MLVIGEGRAGDGARVADTRIGGGDNDGDLPPV
jgi:hypothetical protein